MNQEILIHRIKQTAKLNNEKEIKKIEYIECDRCYKKIEILYVNSDSDKIMDECPNCNNRIFFQNPKSNKDLGHIQKIKIFEYKSKKELEDSDIIFHDKRRRLIFEKHKKIINSILI